MLGLRPLGFKGLMGITFSVNVTGSSLGSQFIKTVVSTVFVKTLLSTVFVKTLLSTVFGKRYLVPFLKNAT